MHSERKLGPLFRLALKSGAAEAIALHIQRGEQLDGRDSSGLTPLMIAAIHNHKDTCIRLIALGANRSLLSSCGRTADQLALDRGHVSLATLISSGSPLNSKRPDYVEFADVAPVEDSSNASSIGSVWESTATYAIPIGAEHVLPVAAIDQIECSDDLNGWAADDSSEVPTHDAACVAAAKDVQYRINQHRRIADETDWSAIEFELPEVQLIRGPIVKEDLPAIDFLIASGLRDGYVLADELRQALESDCAFEFERARGVVSTFLDDLGILIEADAIPLHRSHVENEEIAEILGELRDDLIQPLEPVHTYLSEARRYDLIKREDEERLGRQMDSALGSLTRTLASLPESDWALVFPKNGSIAVTVTRETEDGDDVAQAVDLTGLEEAVEDGDGVQGDFRSYVQLVRDGGPEKGRDSAVPRPSACDIMRMLSTAAQMDSYVLSDVRSSIKSYEHARDRLVTANLRLAISLAHKYLYSSLPLEDLIQEANIGLLRAAERYDFRRGFKFSTYATWWIRQGMSRSIHDTSRTIRVPVHHGEKINVINRARRELDYGREDEVSVDEIAERISMFPRQVLQTMRMDIRVISINDCGPGFEPNTPDPFDIVDPVPDSSKSACDRSLTAAIERMLADLDKRGRQVIMSRFGFDGGGGKTLEEVGQQLGVTRERIRQIESKSLKKFNHTSRIDVLAPYALTSRPVTESQEEE